MNKPFAVSIDVDTVASHLRGYGIADCEDEQSVYELAIPRFLEILNQTNSKATFFLVANSAVKHAGLVQQIISAGHEVASHSMTHCLPFDMKDKGARTRELNQSKQALEEITAETILGFRAPSWDASPELFKGLSSAGYAYDASLFPSWMLLLLRREVSRRSGSASKPLSWGDARILFGRASIHQIDDDLTEIPISTSLFFRVPYYHSLSYLVPSFAQSINGALAALRPGPLTYIFHAVDFLGLNEDQIDPRLSRHPGMMLSLKDKLGRAEEVFKSAPSQALRSLL